MKDFKAGKYISQGSFRSFFPNEINRAWRVDDPVLLDLLGEADRRLGRLEMFSGYVPHYDLFSKMHVTKEATQSSKIEGTQTTMMDALQRAGDLAEEKRDDWREVQNYIAALNAAMDGLTTLPLSTRLIKQTHQILLQGVRGQHKMPGEFRTSQNWIGGASIADARFVPPPAAEIQRLMSDMEQFMHQSSTPFPHLLKIALIHYQFETIHPFLDGNGRVGRLMIMLYLMEQGLLTRPVLYLSDFFERNRLLYYDNLMLVRTQNDIQQWFKFFLVGVIETAEGSIKTYDGLLRLQQDLDQRLATLGSRAPKAQALIKGLYAQPILNANDAASLSGLSAPSTYKLLEDLERMGILQELTGAQRGKKYAFREYLELFQ